MRKMLAVAAAAALVVGCIETKQDYTLNPDGSGKVLVEITMPQMPFGLVPPDQQQDPDLAAKQFVKGILDGSEGVDAWSDVRYEKANDGRTKFLGTAYFKDYSALKFQWFALLFTLTKDDTGGMVLVIKEPESAKPATPPKELPEEQVAQRIQAERTKYQQVRIMMEAIMAKTKIDTSFRLPGTLAEVSGFKKEPSGAVRLMFDGAQVMKVMDKLMADDAYVRQNVLAGKESAATGGPWTDEQMKENLFGTKGPIRARVTGPFKALFPYDSEVAAAKAAQAKMIERLGLDKLPAAPPTPTLPPGFGVPQGRQGKGGY